MKKRLDLRNLDLFAQELAVLQNAYNQIKDDETCACSQVVMVQGHSGTGKSSLIQKLDATIRESSEDDSCYFVSGKFDQQKTTEPYHALAAAFTELCDLIVASGDNKDRTRISFLEQVGSKGRVLVDVVPRMSELVGDVQGRDTTNKDTTSALNQLKYVLRAFVRTVCSVTMQPLVLFLDDLQWADVSSLELIQSLMMDSESKRVLFIGTFRDNEVDEQHPLSIRLRNMGTEREIHSIQLHNLDRDSVNELVSKVTELDPSSTMPLTEVVYHKTNGNMFFLLQFLGMLEEDELLYFSLSLYKWTWDVDKIKAQTSLSENVVEFVAGKIQRLSPKTQAALKLASCLWSTFEVDLLREVMSRGVEYFDLSKSSFKDAVSTDDDLVSLLDKAAEEGLLDKLSGTRYKFAHDRIRQAAFSLIPEGRERECIHYWMGGLLWEMTDSPRCEEWMHFAAADQMNRGASYISDAEKRLDLARLNLLVGEKAISLSAFVPALSYLKSGIDQLPGNRWTQHYDLTLRLYNALVDMEYCTGNFSGIQEITNEISTNAKSSKDKADSLYTLGLSLMAQVKQPEAITLCHSMLGSIGEPLPKRVTKATVTLEYVRLRLLLRGKTDDDLLKLPQMMHEDTLIAVKFQDLLVSSMLYSGMMREVNFIAIRMMILMLRYGICEESPLAFVLWGQYLADKGLISEAYRFGKLSLKLGERLPSKTVKANVVMLAFGFLNHWKEPLQNGLDTLLEAHKSGMVNGDITWAFQCITGYQLNYFYGGLPLSSGAQDLIAYSNQMREYNQEAVRRSTVPVLQLMLNLMGRGSSSVLELTGEVMNQDEFENIKTNPNRLGLQAIASCRMQLAYYFDAIDLAEELSNELQSITKDSVFSASFIVCQRLMFFGLISTALARKKKKRKHAADALRIITHLQDKWVKRGAVNVLHKFLLLKAEYATLKNSKAKKARQDFDAAISTARRVGFIQDEALANERAGEFFLDQGDEFWASSYLSRAHELYSEWGARAKVDALEKKHSLFLSKHEELKSSSRLRGRSRFTDKESKTHKTLNPNELLGDAVEASP